MEDYDPTSSVCFKHKLRVRIIDTKFCHKITSCKPCVKKYAWINKTVIIDCFDAEMQVTKLTCQYLIQNNSVIVLFLETKKKKC